jgi:hypothetical protein
MKKGSIFRVVLIIGAIGILVVIILGVLTFAFPMAAVNVIVPQPTSQDITKATNQVEVGSTKAKDGLATVPNQVVDCGKVTMDVNGRDINRAGSDPAFACVGKALMQECANVSVDIAPEWARTYRPGSGEWMTVFSDGRKCWVQDKRVWVEADIDHESQTTTTSETTQCTLQSLNDFYQQHLEHTRATNNAGAYGADVHLSISTINAATLAQDKQGVLNCRLEKN